MEWVKDISGILGMILSATSVFVLIKTKALGKLGSYVRKESKVDENKRVDEETSKRIDEMNAILQSYMEEDRAFKEEIKHSIAVQHNACMQLLANIVETTYYACKNKKTLTMNEFKRIVNAFSIYMANLMAIHILRNYITK